MQSPGVDEIEDIHKALEANFDKGSIIAVSDDDLDILFEYGFDPEKIDVNDVIEIMAENIVNVNVPEAQRLDNSRAQRSALIEFWTNRARGPDGGKRVSELLSILKTLHKNRGEAGSYRYVVLMGETGVFYDLAAFGHAGMQNKTFGKDNGLKTVYVPIDALLYAEDNEQGLQALITHEKTDLKEGVHKRRGNEELIMNISQFSIN